MFWFMLSLFRSWGALGTITDVIVGLKGYKKMDSNGSDGENVLHMCGSWAAFPLYPSPWITILTAVHFLFFRQVTFLYAEFLDNPPLLYFLTLRSDYWSVCSCYLAGGIQKVFHQTKCRGLGECPLLCWWAVNLGALCVQQKDTIIVFSPRLLCRVWRKAVLQGDRLSFSAVLFPTFENLSSEAYKRGFHKVTLLYNTKALTGFPHHLMYRGYDTWEQVLEMNASFQVYSCAGLGAAPSLQQTECLVPFISSFWCEIQQVLHPSCNAVFL